MDTATGVAPLGPEDTNGAIWSNGNIPAASPLEYRAAYRNTGIYTQIQGCLLEKRGGYKDRIGTLGTRGY